MNNNIVSAALAEKSLFERPTYGFIKTSDIISRFNNQQWYVSSSNQASVRKASKQGYQKHIVRFRNNNFLDVLSGDNQSHLELVLRNSHDGSGAFELMLGFYRLACSNGLIVGTSLSSIKVVHSKNALIKLDNAIETLVKQVPDTIERVKYLSNKTISTDNHYQLVKSVVDQRLSTINGIRNISYESATRVRRSEDNKQDAFTCFNRLQESVIRGGIQFTQDVTDKNGDVIGFRHRTTKALTSINQTTKLNKFMWNEMERIVA